MGLWAGDGTKGVWFWLLGVQRVGESRSPRRARCCLRPASHAAVRAIHDDLGPHARAAVHRAPDPELVALNETTTPTCLYLLTRSPNPTSNDRTRWAIR